ncbi:MAG: Sec-independent protein translocase subunit TatA/TatB [Flavobacteriales bacterium]
MSNLSSIFLFLNLSGGEIFIILLFVLIFFGAESIPKIAKTFGKVMYQVKNATDDIKRDIKESTDNIKKDMLDQTGISNPLEEVKKEINESVKDINTEL